METSRKPQSGALTYKITDETSAYASYVESVAPPVIGVEPERGEQCKFGVKCQPAGTNALFTAAVYDLTKNDITVPVILPDGSIDRQVIGRMGVRGVEIEGEAELANNLNLIAWYAYTESEVLRSLRDVDVEGNQITSTTKHMASLWLNYDLPGARARGDVHAVTCRSA